MRAILTRLAAASETPWRPHLPESLVGLREEDALLAGFLCALVDAPEPAHLLRVHVAVLYLLEHSLRAAGEQEAVGKPLRDQVVELLQLLQAEYTRSQDRKRWPRPTTPVDEIPIYYFHRHFHDCACGVIHRFEELETLLPAPYRDPGWEVHLNLRRLARACAGRNDRQTLYRTSLAARQVLQHFPPGEALPANLKELVSSHAAQEALRAHHRSSSRGSQSPERRKKLEEEYVAQSSRHLERLLSHQPPLPRRRWGGDERVGDHPWIKRINRLVEQGEYRGVSIGRGGSRITTTWRRSKRELLRLAREGVALDEEAEEVVELLDLPSTTRAGWLAWRMRAALSYRFAVAPLWSREGVTLYQLAQLYQRCFHLPWESLSWQEKAAVALALVCLHTGMLPKVVQQAPVGTWRKAKGWLERQGVYLDTQRWTFVGLLPVQLATERLLRGPSSILGLPRGVVVSPLSALIRGLLREVVRAQRLRPGDPWLPGDLEFDAVLPEGVTLRRLSRAFEFLYTCYFGLEPELAGLVAFRPVTARVAGMHYFCSNYETLTRSYLTTHGQVQQLIVQECRSLGMSLKPPQPPPVPALELSGPVGSIFTPSLVEARRWLELLRERLRQARSGRWSGFGTWRNWLAVYAWEVLRATTGVRPMAAPPFGDKVGAWLKVSDKMSPGRLEWRLVPLHPLVRQLLILLAQANRQLEKTPFWPLVDKERLPGPDSLFFLVDDKHHALPLSFRAMKEFLAREGIVYPFVANAWRHLVRSYLAGRCSHRVADALLGHHHRGPDALDVLHLEPVGSQVEGLEGAVDELVAELGIQLPEGWG